MCRSLLCSEHGPLGAKIQQNKIDGFACLRSAYYKVIKYESDILVYESDILVLGKVLLKCWLWLQTRWHQNNLQTIHV